MLKFVDPVVEMFPWQGKPTGAAWNDLSHCATLQAAVEQVAEIYEFKWHPYFIWMRSQGATQTQFVQSQVPFQYAIETFSDAYTAVFERAECPTVPAVPAPIIATINPPRLAFQRCLQGLAPRVNLSTACPIGLAAANRQVLNHCLTQPIGAGAAMLGMIEYLYVDVSATLAQIIQHRNWAHQDSDFYCMIHEALELDRSRDLLTLASASWLVPETRDQSARSLMLGAQYLWDLYDGLYPE
jgi:pyrroloquinoline-quinone synthase